jgi:hypothetical protein
MMVVMVVEVVMVVVERRLWWFTPIGKLQNPGYTWVPVSPHKMPIFNLFGHEQKTHRRTHASSPGTSRLRTFYAVPHKQGFESRS